MQFGHTDVRLECRTHAIHWELRTSRPESFTPPRLLCFGAHAHRDAVAPSYPTLPPRPRGAGPLLDRSAARSGIRDPESEATKKRSPSGPLLPRRGNPGPGGLRRRLPGPLPQGPGERRADHRVRGRPVHGRDRQDPESVPQGRPAGLRGRLLARGLLPARGLPRLAAGAPRGGLADLHQLLGRREGALGHHRDLVERREDRAVDPAGQGDPLRARTATSAPSSRRSSAGR